MTPWRFGGYSREGCDLECVGEGGKGEMTRTSSIVRSVIFESEHVPACTPSGLLG